MLLQNYSALNLQMAAAKTSLKTEMWGKNASANYSMDLCNKVVGGGIGLARLGPWPRFQAQGRPPMPFPYRAFHFAHFMQFSHVLPIMCAEILSKFRFLIYFQCIVDNSSKNFERIEKKRILRLGWDFADFGRSRTWPSVLQRTAGCIERHYSFRILRDLSRPIRWLG